MRGSRKGYGLYGHFAYTIIFYFREQLHLCRGPGAGYAGQQAGIVRGLTENVVPSVVVGHGDRGITWIRR